MHLKKFLVSLDVKNKWKKECFVDWLSGEPIDDISKINYFDSWLTHCSSFLSSVCFKLDVPFLIPPKVRTEGLANKQYMWLSEHGIKYGWLKISKDNIKNYINENYLIIACQYSTYDPNCGHVAIVIDYIDDDIYVCQAGKINSSYIKLCDAFCDQNKVEYWIYNKKIKILETFF